MSTRESLIQNSNSNNALGERNGFDAVANLVASLLDDITVANNGVVSTHIASTHINGSQPGNHNGTIESKVVSKEIFTITPQASSAIQVETYEPAPLPDLLPATGHHPVPPALSTLFVPPASTLSPLQEIKTPEVKMTAADTEITFFKERSDTDVVTHAVPVESAAVTFTPPLKSADPPTTAPTPVATSESASSLLVEPITPGQFHTDGLALNIKGRGDGVTIEIGKGNWEILVDGLHQRLTHAGSFFRGGNAALDLADRTLTEPDLRAICDVLVTHGMKPALVRTSSDRTFQSALMIGLASTLETKDGHTVETIQAANSNQEAIQHYVYRGALRSGQVLKRRSHVLIIGDVNPGSEVIATGDILVWGRLRGAAHAGAEGDVRAVVAAFDIDPVQLRIAEAVALGNGAQSETGYRWFWSRNSEKRPEIARLVNGQILVEPWDEAKTAGSPVLKRRR